MSYTNWVITGGCGFIGTRLIENLVNEGGHRIVVLDNLSAGKREDLGSVCDFNEIKGDKNIAFDSQIQLYVGDIKSGETCVNICHNADVIVHLAANTGVGPSVENPRSDMENNVTGIFNMLESARINKVKKFIFASSGAPIGECEPPIHEELAPHPVSPYGASKLAGEGYCSAYYRTFGIETVVLRFGNVYGPGSVHKNSIVAKFIKKIMADEPFEIYGDGSQTRDYIYIDDLVQAIRFAVNVDNIGGEIFQIATNAETTVQELLDTMVFILKRHGVKDIQVLHGEKRLGDVMRNFSNTIKAKNTLGWKANYDLEKGLAETVNYFIKVSH